MFSAVSTASNQINPLNNNDTVITNEIQRQITGFNINKYTEMQHPDKIRYLLEIQRGSSQTVSFGLCMEQWHQGSPVPDPPFVHQCQCDPHSTSLWHTCTRAQRCQECSPLAPVSTKHTQCLYHVQDNNRRHFLHKQK